MITLPLAPVAERTFQITYQNIPYDITLLWNRRLGKMTMNIVEDDGYTVNGISVISGINFIERFSFTTLKNMYAVNTNNYREDLNFDELGVESQIVILTDSEVDNLENEQGAT